MKNYSKDMFLNVVYYDPLSITGLRWKYDLNRHNSDTCYCHKAGDCAGTLSSSTGYYYIRVNGKMFAVHRVILILNDISIDGMQVDHIDGNKLNNKLSNLRVVSAKENRRNMKRNSRNTSGVTGVNYLEIVNDSGKVYRYYRANFTNENGNRVSKMFNIDVLGEKVAFSLAVKFRENGILQTNLELISRGFAPYSDTHGDR